MTKYISYGLLITIATLFVLGAISFGTRACSKAEEATHLHDAVQRYEEFQEIHNTCIKLNTDLCNMKDIPNDDPMFDQFSKAQRILAIKTQLNKWIEEYNSKSKMWGRSLWKSNTLPYQLTNQQFSCNN